MSTSIYRVLFGLSFLVLGACSKEPDTIDDTPPSPRAAFSVNTNQTADLAFRFEFTNNSEHAVSYEWDFGDGGNSTLFEPSHIYQDHGAFVVTLTAFAGNGESSQSQDTVEIGYNYLTEVSYNLSGFSFESFGSYPSECPDYGVFNGFDGELVGRNELEGSYAVDKRFSNLFRPDSTAIGFRLLHDSSLVDCLALILPNEPLIFLENELVDGQLTFTSQYADAFSNEVREEAGTIEVRCKFEFRLE